MLRLILILTLSVSWQILAIAAVPADAAIAADLAEQAKPCAACHGDRGRAAPDGYYPRIAGKPAPYLLNQLRNFKEGRRYYEPMTHLLQNMDDVYLQELAQYFANLDLPYPPPSQNKPGPADEKLSRTIVYGESNARKNPSCTSCHADDLMGDGYSVPPLLGLSVDYINAQFGAWRNELRQTAHPDCMDDIADQLNPKEINAVAAWLAATPVPAKTPRVRVTDFSIPCADTAPVQGSQVKPSPVSRGQYIALAGNCAGCHSVPTAPPYSGGLKIKTPFGAIWSTNLTPDKSTGLGNWTPDDFYTAMTQGISRDGHALYPAFPYANYSGMTRDDSDALFQWLQSLPAVNNPAKPNELEFPYNTRAALWGWRELYFTAKPFKSDPAKSGEHNRGAYLVEVLGHCGACHGERNRFGAVASRDQFGGQIMPSGQWFSPSLLDPNQSGVQQYAIQHIVDLLGAGKTDSATVNGPMANIVFDSLQHLTLADRKAMAVYLKALPTQRAEQNKAPRFPRSSKPGEALYEEHCADCHGENGRSDRYPNLAGNRSITQHNLTNLISTTLQGGYLPGTQSNRRPLGMPPFGPLLTDQQIAQILTYIRSAFGNRAGAVFGSDVSRLR
jgi:cytochrome c553